MKILKASRRVLTAIICGLSVAGMHAQTLVSVDPADGSSIETFSGVTLNFDQTVTTKRNWSMDINIRVGSISGTKVSVAEWELEKVSDTAVKIYPGNSSGNLTPVEMTEGTDYYLTIPAGEIKEYNTEIVLHYTGATASAPALAIESYDPADGASIASFEGVTVTFNGKVSPKLTYTSAVKLASGSTTGDAVSVYEWKMETVGNDGIKIYPVNHNGDLTPVDMLVGTEYYLTIPAGQINEWKEDIVLHYAGATEPLAIESYDPADGASVASFEGVTITFNGKVTTKSLYTGAIKLTTGSSTGEAVSVSEWKMENAGDDAIKVYPVNNNGDLTPVEMLEGTEYYLTIPTGEINEWKEDIVLHYSGAPAAAPALEIVSVTPADEANIKTFDGVTIEFNNPVSLRSSWSNKISLTTGSATGDKVSVAEWEMEKVGDTGVKIYPGNNSAVLTPVALVEGTDYYLTIPAGEVKEWTEPIVLHYTNKSGVQSGVEFVEEAEDVQSVRVDGRTITLAGKGEAATFDLYLLNGSLVATDVDICSVSVPGVYIVKVGTAAVKVVVK